MAWYRTGTVSVANGSTTVNGAGTAWIDGAGVGEAIKLPDGQLYEIATINSATQLTLATPYLGATANGQTYTIVPTQSYIRDLAARAGALVQQFADVVNVTGAGKFASGSIAAPSLRAIGDENTGVNLPGSDALQLVTNGTERVLIQSDGAIVASGRVIGTKGTSIQTDSSDTNALSAPLIVRERNSGAAQGNADAAAPRLSIFWAGVFGGQISVDSQGFKLLNENGVGTNFAPIRTGNLGVNGQLAVKSGAQQWYGIGASTVPASAGAYFKGGTTSPVGYLGTDGGALFSNGVGESFGMRSESELILQSQLNTVRPGIDANQALGSGAYRWGSVRAVTAAFDGLTITGRHNVSSGQSQWAAYGADAISSSYAVYYKGGTTTAVGYVGSDGGGIVGGGAGNNFGVRAEGHLLFNSQQGIVRPTTDNDTSLGTSSFRWSTIYLGSNPAVTSDERVKLEQQPSALGLNFIRRLKSISYRLADSKSVTEQVPDGEETVQEPVTEDVPVVRLQVDVVNGIPVQREVTVIEQQPVVDMLPVVDAAGVPVVRHIAAVLRDEPEVVDVIPAVLDEDGKVLAAERRIVTRAARQVEVEPARDEPVLHAVPRMCTVTRQRTKAVSRFVEGARRHHGLSAQQVAQALADHGLTGRDFAGLIRDEESDTWGLRYEQFIPVLIDAVQEQQQQIESLQTSLLALSSRLAALENPTTGA